MQDSLLTIRDVTKRYASKRHVTNALRGVSLEIYRGEVLGLLGVNGAGKTTLSSILATLHPLTTGEVLWQGASIYDNLVEYRMNVGLAPQKPNLEKGLRLDEILIISGRCYGLSKSEAKERCNDLVDQLGLQQYTTSKVDQLSGGYRQRFLIARALMHNPQLVILDEPTVGLDPHIRRELWEVITTLRSRGVTVLLTTHYLDEAEHLSDRVCLIHEGLIRTIDTPENLIKLHQKSNLEEVFLKFVDDPDAEIFTGGGRDA